LCDLAINDSTPWEHAFNGTDCEYINTFNGITYRINCNPARKCFSLNGVVFHLSEKESKFLCELILIQLGRIKMKEKIEEIEIVNKTFEVVPKAS
jgi:hypothetical protein